MRPAPERAAGHRAFPAGALPLALLVAAGCAHVQQPAPEGPEAVARDFAAHLDRGDLERAWALSAGVDREGFVARYGEAGARATRALAVRSAASGQRGPGGPVQLSFEAAGWRVREEPARASDEDVRRVLGEFLDAAERREFTAVWTMLSARWRARYTPARLESDFEAEPQVRERLARARAASGGALVLEPDRAALTLGEGKSLKLEREGQQWRVAALE